jgi:lantibiotic transport system ATP-binding protein
VIGLASNVIHMTQTEENRDAAPREWVVETEGLTKTFGKDAAVDGVDLKIAKGDIYGFLGPNGAGKTTTIRMLLGLVKPTRGTVRIFGKDMAAERIAILRKVGSLVESPSYYPHLTARENLETLRIVLGTRKSRIDEVLDIVRLADAADKKVKTFSLGMKQRLGIAAALLHEPELLILDEPTNGLDPGGIIEIRELIKRMPETFGVTVLISSHLLAEVDQVATRVGVLDKGKLLFQGPIDQMRELARPTVRLKTSDPESARRVLLSRGISLRRDGEWLALDDRTDEKVAEAVAWLVREGFAVYRVEEEKRPLEQIFLQMTAGGKAG